MESSQRRLDRLERAVDKFESRQGLTNFPPTLLVVSGPGAYPRTSTNSGPPRIRLPNSRPQKLLEDAADFTRELSIRFGRQTQPTQMAHAWASSAKDLEDH